MALSQGTRFFISNFLKGLLWLALFVAGYILFKKYVRLDFLVWLKPIFDHPLIIFSIYSVSELIVGIIPPEIFFIWATQAGSVEVYIHFCILLSVISYLAGLAAFWFGHKLNGTVIFRFLKRKYLAKYIYHLNTYGSFLIIVSAMTPVPFSGSAMLMGSVGYPFRKFWIYALSRFLRFLIYSIVFWEVMEYEMAI